MSTVTSYPALNIWARIFGFLGIALAHPLYLGLSYFIIVKLEWVTVLANKSFFLNALPLCLLPLAFGCARYLTFSMLNPTERTNPYQTLDRFIWINLWALPGLFAFVLMLMPIEASSFNSLFLPIIIISGVILESITSLRSYKTRLTK